MANFHLSKLLSSYADLRTILLKGIEERIRKDEGNTEREKGRRRSPPYRSRTGECIRARAGGQEQPTVQCMQLWQSGLALVHFWENGEEN